MLTTVLFTFDYELFLGHRSGKAVDCLIHPTERLLELLGQYGFKGIFFIDTVYLMRLQEIAADNDAAGRDLAAIQTQLGEIVRQGHDIFPHIHAHWLDAEYDPAANEWSLKNTRYYQFSSLSAEQQQYLFDRSVGIIGAVAKQAVKGYVIDSYRAGGWSIQPFSYFKACFLRHGIKHEWSVMPGKYQFSDAHTFDFRKAPSPAHFYRFGDDPCIEDKNGYFTEWAISTITLTPFEKWINFKVSGLLQRLAKKEESKGSTVSSAITEQGDVYANGGEIRRAASFEGLNPFTLRKYLSAIGKQSYFHFISHPKLLTSFEFRMIRKLFNALNTSNKIETDFRKIVI